MNCTSHVHYCAVINLLWFYSIFHRVLHTVLSKSFYQQYVQLPRANAPLSDFIEKNPRFYPFFKDCIGAIDGTHIRVSPPQRDKPRYRNRKGGISQNVLAASSFEMRVHYALGGWEGSATDGTVFEDARSHDLRIPQGKYYLADAGFSSCDTLLVPYRGVRYHLKEWVSAKERYAIMIFFMGC